MFVFFPPSTRHAPLAVIRYKCVLGHALLEDSPSRQIIGKRTSGLTSSGYISPLVSNEDRAVVRRKTGQKVWKGWQLEECKVQCQLFRLVLLKDQFKLKGLESKEHNSVLWQGELIQPCQRSQRKHSHYDFNSKINVPLLTPLAFFISGAGAIQKSSVSVRVRKIYQVRWNTILFTIKTGFVGQ